MSILSSDIIQDIINELSVARRKNKFNSNKIPKFVFICGQQIIDEHGIVKSREVLENEQNKRQVVVDKLEKNDKHNIVCVISEKIYNNSVQMDTLTFEELLAELSDKIIIIIESYGTVCELGAFTVKDRYLKKLLVINDRLYSSKKSFINEGPVRKILENNEEKYILADYGYDLFKGNFQINENIKNIKEENITILPNNDSGSLDLKNLVYELLNIIELFEPIMAYELFYIYKKVKGFNNYNIKNREKHGINSPCRIISLMERMELIESHRGYVRKKGYYTCFDALFNINRDKYNKIRNKISYEIMKSYPDRFVGDENEDITVNE